MTGLLGTNKLLVVLGSTCVGAGVRLNFDAATADDPPVWHAV